MAGISKAEREALAEVKSKFDAVMPSDEQITIIENLRKAFAKVAVEVHRTVPGGRNKSLAMTALEDGCMRAIRGVTHDSSPDQPVEPEPAAPAPSEDEPVQAPEPSTDDEPTTPLAPEAAPKRRRGPRRRTQEVVETPAA